MATPKKDPRKRVVTPECTISYPRLFTPQPGPQGGEPKYSCALVFDSGTDVSALKAAANIAGIEKFGEEEFRRLVQNDRSFKIPFRTDVEGKGYPEGSMFFNATTKNRPGVVGPDVQEISDPNVVYAGCRVKASVTAFGFNNVSKGVAFALNNVQFLRDGERLDGGMAASEEFDSEMSNEPASLSDVEKGLL